MSKMADMSYDIEQMYIEGYSPRSISTVLEIPVELVYQWIEAQSLDVQEEFDPYETINS